MRTKKKTGRRTEDAQSSLYTVKVLSNEDEVQTCEGHARRVRRGKTGFFLEVFKAPRTSGVGRWCLGDPHGVGRRNEVRWSRPGREGKGAEDKENESGRQTVGRRG